MPKWSSYLTRFLLLMALGSLMMTVAFFGLSDYFFNQVYTSTHYASLSKNLQAADELLRQYQAGEIDQDTLRASVNPTLNPDSSFYMLLDTDARVLAYTNAAAPYFAGGTKDALIARLKTDGAAVVHGPDADTLVLIMGEKTDYGYVLAGKTMRVYSRASLSFRTKLMISMGMVLCTILLLSTFAARKVSRPARMLTETATRLADGEQVLLPENMPGEEMREIAKAFNYMSRTIAKAIQDLRHEKDTMALVLSGLNEGILAVDARGQVIHENPAARSLLGEGDARQTVLDALMADEQAPEWGGKIHQGDRILQYMIGRLTVEEGEAPRGTVALIRDITEEERLERTRHDYVANISHELRTPLASMRGLAEGLRDGMVTEEKDRQRYYNIIVNEVTRLSRLVNDLLELSSLQSNPAAFEMETIDPNELIYDLHDRNGSLFREKGLAFVRSLPEEPLPDVWSNEDRLAQVLTIFLDNARKYTPAGGTVTLGAEKAPGGVRFFVRDTGIGMDEETRRMAFERFHQAERSRSDKGSGLGLSIAKEILQKMDVAIRLESQLGQGSEFSFVINEKEKA